MEGAGRRGRVVQVVGDDVDGDWLTWRWDDSDRPVGMHRVKGLRESAVTFRSALPREPDSDEGKGPCDLEWLMTFKTVSWQDELKRLGLYGPLTRRDGELELMRALSRALLPDGLRRQLVEATVDGERVEVRMTSSPPAAIIPWGLLVLDDGDTRLLDVADVSWVAPILPCDAGPDVPRATPATGGRTLHVIDPKTSKGRVLPGTFESCGCHGHGTEQLSAEYNDLEGLWARLEAGAREIARLFMTGHRAIETRGAAGTVFFMDDGEVDKLRASRLMRETGRQRVPPRVGVVACASGTDLAQHEPFGFGTALLVNGAEVLQTALWTLPTDHAIGLVDTGAVGALEWPAQVVDHVQSDADPVVSLCDLQRKKLAAWREKLGLGPSPLLQGVLITMMAPTGCRQDPGSTSIPQSSGYVTAPW